MARRGRSGSLDLGRPLPHELRAEAAAPDDERHRFAGPGIEDHDADRRGLDQRLEVGARPLLVAVGARIGDRGRGLGGEQHQHLFVFFGELLAARLLRQEEVADVHAPVTHRRSLERPGEDPGGCKAERADVVREVREPQRSRQVVQVLEQAHAVGPGREFLLLLRGEARGDGVLGRARLVDGGDDAVAGAGERRAVSTTSPSTVSRSRLALIRRIAALRVAMRSRSASFSRCSWERLKGPSSPNRARIIGRRAAGGAGFAMDRAVSGVLRYDFTSEFMKTTR